MSARNCLGAALVLLMGVGIGWMGERLWTESRPHTETPAPHGAAKKVSTPRTPPHAASQSRLAKRWKRIEEGSEAARLDLASALKGLEAMKHPKEYGSLLEGIFSYLAETAPPAEALRHALALSNSVQRHYALRIVAETWLADDLAGPYGSGVLTNDGKGMIVKAARWLNSADSTAPPGAAKAWLEAFADHPARAELAAAYAETHIMEDPQAQLARAQEFTPWERDTFLQTALSVWAAAQAGLQPQDRLVEIVEDGGEPVRLQGRELSEVVNDLRGEAGTITRLRVLRPGPDGKLSEHVLQIERKQLIMPSSHDEPRGE